MVTPRKRAAAKHHPVMLTVADIQRSIKTWCKANGYSYRALARRVRLYHAAGAARSSGPR